MTLDSIQIVDDEFAENGNAVIKIIGVGGGGCNAVNRMIDSGIKSGIQFIAANTDRQALNKSKAPVKLVLGSRLTHGLGAGGKPEVGERAALEDKELIKDAIEGANMVFITAGMGGGTGTGGAPIIAQVAKELEILTVAIVTTPFALEGKVKQKYAEDGIKKLRENVDTLIVIPNENLLKNLDQKTTMVEAFRMADDVLRQGILGISTLITGHGEINIDFADVKTIMKDKGDAIMGIGEGHGDNKAVDAVTNAIYNKVLQDTNIDGATGLLIGITGGSDLTMTEFQEILKIAGSSADENVLLIYGLAMNPEMKDKVSVTVIATGFSSEKKEQISTVEPPKPEKKDVVTAREWEKLQQGISRKEEVRLENSHVQNDIDIPAIYRFRDKMNLPPREK